MALSSLSCLSFVGLFLIVFGGLGTCIAPCVGSLLMTTVVIEQVNDTLTTASSSVSFSPVQILDRQPLRMIQGKTRPVKFGYANFLGEYYTLGITSSDTSVVRVVEDVVLPFSSTLEETVIWLNDTQNANNSLAFALSTANFTIEGIRFGKAHLLLQLRSTDTGEIDEVLTQMLPKPAVAVIRLPTSFDIAFGYALLAVSALTTGIMGCEIELEPLKVIFKRPFGILIGAGCQFIIMPLTAFLLCIAFKLPNDLAIGVLLAACSPGGGMSNMTTVVVEGNLLLSVAMTFMSTCLAIGMMPLNLFIYSRRFMDNTTFPIPFDKIILGLAFLLGPLTLGFILRRFKPSLAIKLLKVLKPACLIVVLFTMAGGMYTIRYVFTYIIPSMIICSFLLPPVAFILGGSTALLVRRPIDEVKTISIETGIQNVAIAGGVIRLTYPYPEADMVSATVMWTMLGQFCAVTVMISSYVVYKKLCKKSKTHTRMRDTDNTEEPMQLPQNGTIVAPAVQVTTDPNLYKVHAHLVRIPLHNGHYQQLPQTKTNSSPNTNGNAKHNRIGVYQRMFSATSSEYLASEATEMEMLSHIDCRKSQHHRPEIVNVDSLWQPNPQARHVDFTVFTDEED